MCIIYHCDGNHLRCFLALSSHVLFELLAMHVHLRTSLIKSIKSFNNNVKLC